MVPKKTTCNAANQLNQNVAEVRRLIEIHKSIGGTGPGRKSNVEILNKSAIVLTVACWEAFAEDVCEEALEFVIDRANDHSVFPKSVLERVASKHSGIKAWDFAGQGWKQTLRDNMTEVLARTTKSLNTPRTANINELFLKTLGLEQVSSSWYWKGRSIASTEKALDDLITLRGEIAHRVTTAKAVHRTTVVNAIELVFRLSVKTSNAIRMHTHGLVGVHPWAQPKFKKTNG